MDNMHSLDKNLNFEICSLLKDKGFNMIFIKIGKVHDVPLFIPTISHVIMWLYIEHDIWISVINTPIKEDYFEFQISKVNGTLLYNSNQYNKKLKIFKSPITAYEKAILYTITNLI